MTASADFGRHRRHANPFTLRAPLMAPPMDALFGRRAPLALDIGCGQGSFVLSMAKAHPMWNVLGLEIRPHLVEGINMLAQRQNLLNARAVLANANVHLAALVPDASLVQVSLNFPDPWYKRRHHKRRVLTAALMDSLLPKLRPGAQLHLMTDFAPLAHQMRQILLARPELRCAHPNAEFASQSTTGLPSEREIKHQGRGETIYRLLFAYQLGQTRGKLAETAL
jgi:tRNA (guanine-N7-)-methyltransferase